MVAAPWDSPHFLTRLLGVTVSRQYRPWRIESKASGQVLSVLCDEKRPRLQQENLAAATPDLVCAIGAVHPGTDDDRIEHRD